jgi:predicted dehydrogenase
MKVVIFGLGSIGKKHVKALNDLVPDVQVYALRSNPNSEQHSGITNIYSMAEIPSDTDFFIIASPTSTHQRLAKELIKFSKPIFIEKPIFSEVSHETSRILSEIKKQNIKTYVAYSLRFHPCIQFLKNELKDKQHLINEVNIYCGSFLPSWRPNENFREVYSAIPELGGGVHLDLSHEIDYAYHLFGNPQRVSNTLTNGSTLKIRAVDYANYLLEYNNFSVNITLNYYRVKPKREIEILFEDDIWVADLIKSEVRNAEGEVIFAREAGQVNNLANQMRAFLESLNNNTPTSNDAFEAYEVLKICLNDAKR